MKKLNQDAKAKIVERFLADILQEGQRLSTEEQNFLIKWALDLSEEASTTLLTNILETDLNHFTIRLIGEFFSSNKVFYFIDFG